MGFSTFSRSAATLLVCVALSAQAATPAGAQAQVTLNIKAQPVREALQAFGKQTGLQILFRSEGIAIEGRTAPAVVGRLSAAEALEQLLGATGLRYEFVNEHTVRISAAGGEPAATRVGAQPESEHLKELRLAQAEGDPSTSSQRDTSSGSEEFGTAREKNPQITELEEIVVTGSRIKRTELEGPAPVTTITREQMDREGFTTVYDALNSMTQATGSGSQLQFSIIDNFTPNAQQIDLRGLGAGRTLVLLNGRRAADYPLPFGDDSNFVNLNSIPLAMVERIEVLSGGASAIYGSDAVAGVINIVMKNRVTETSVTALLGNTTEGGGATGRVQLTSGLNRGAFHGAYGLEYYKQKPIWAFQRHAFDSEADSPAVGLGVPVFNDPNLIQVDPVAPAFGGSLLVDPTAEVCSEFPNTQRAANPNGLGFYCGNPRLPAQMQIRGDKENVSGFSNFTYDFSDRLRLFGTLMGWRSLATPRRSNPQWIGDVVFASGPGFPADCPYCALVGGQYWEPIRIFDRSESDGGQGRRYDERVWDAVLGVGGTLVGNRFDWEFAYHHANYDITTDGPVFLKERINDFYLGPQLTDGSGTALFDPLLGTFPVHSVRRDRLLRPLTPAELTSLQANNHSAADSSNDQINLQLTGELFALPAGQVKFAGVLEWGTQQYELRPDPRLLAGDFYGTSGSTGGGQRDRYAAGIELAIPVIEKVRATLAARYDKYDDITNVDDAATYNAGLEFRPIPSLLLRGSYATSFRAPDMHFVFAGPSAFTGLGIDEFRCRREGRIPEECASDFFSSFASIGGGVPTLTEEKGKSYTLGAVWNPVESFDVSADYFDIELKDAVQLLGVSETLQVEADCRLGATQGGRAVDPNSQFCQRAIAAVTRNPVNPADPFSEAITSVETRAYNRAFRAIRGIDAKTNYRLQLDRWGQVSFNLSWSHVLGEKRQELPLDPVVAFRDDSLNFDLRSRVSSSVTWQKGKWAQTLFGERQGSRPYVDQSLKQGRTEAYSLFNYSTSWAPSERLRLLLNVNNLFDESPLIDPTAAAYPFFSSAYLNPYGREVFVQASYSFK